MSELTNMDRAIAAENATGLFVLQLIKLGPEKSILESIAQFSRKDSKNGDGWMEATDEDYMCGLGDILCNLMHMQREAGEDSDLIETCWFSDHSYIETPLPYFVHYLRKVCEERGFDPAIVLRAATSSFDAEVEEEEIET